MTLEPLQSQGFTIVNKSGEYWNGAKSFQNENCCSNV